MNTLNTRGYGNVRVTEGDDWSLIRALNSLMDMRSDEQLNDEQFRAEVYDMMHIYWYGHFNYSKGYGTLR